LADTTNTTKGAVVVTGVSSGIGRAVAEALIADGRLVFGSVRKQEDADKAADALGAAFRPLLFDVTNRDEVDAAAAEVKEALSGATLAGLVNNAGVAIGGPVRYIPVEEIRRQFEVNIFGVVHTTQAFLPLLGADRAYKGPPGKIVNMSSIAGKIASPFMSPYAMSKHALEAFSDALRRELFVHGIDVVVVGPGAVQTPIWAKADDLDFSPYQGTEYEELLNRMKKAMQEVGEEGLPPSDIGALVCEIMNTDRPKTRNAIQKNKLLMWTLPRLLPTRALDNVIADRFGIEKRKK